MSFCIQNLDFRVFTLINIQRIKDNLKDNCIIKLYIRDLLVGNIKEKRAKDFYKNWYIVREILKKEFDLYTLSFSEKIIKEDEEDLGYIECTIHNKININYIYYKVIPYCLTKEENKMTGSLLGFFIGNLSTNNNKLSPIGRLSLMLLRIYSNEMYLNKYYFSKIVIDWYYSSTKDIIDIMFHRLCSGISKDQSLYEIYKDMNNNSRIKIKKYSNIYLILCYPLFRFNFNKKDIVNIFNIYDPISIDAINVYLNAIKEALKGKTIEEIFETSYKKATTLKIKQIIEMSKKNLLVKSDDSIEQSIFIAFSELWCNNGYDISINNIIIRDDNRIINATITGGLLGAYYGYTNIQTKSLEIYESRQNESYLSLKDLYLFRNIKINSK